jgi:hypothetical protein
MQVATSHWGKASGQSCTVTQPPPVLLVEAALLDAVAPPAPPLPEALAVLDAVLALVLEAVLVLVLVLVLDAPPALAVLLALDVAEPPPALVEPVGSTVSPHPAL